jgi:DNA processing protein
VDIIQQKDYPPGLKAIDDPPIVLYVKGDLRETDAVAIGIVGSRRCTFYGRSQAERLGSILAARGVTVVSGMARGIDSAAHRGALGAGGRTLAVMGNGLSSVYPPENRDLFEKISANGAAISEFPMDMAPLPGNFPRRNRLISGLSLGVVVVEAALDSGSLITARLALEQGREVFAVPGKAGSPTSRGTHSLIRDGAKLVEDVDDILDEFEGLGKALGIEKPAGAPARDLSDSEMRIFESLSPDEPENIEDLIEKCGLQAGEVSGLLVQMELKGLVKCLPGKSFVKVLSL